MFNYVMFLDYNNYRAKADIDIRKVWHLAE